MQLEKDTQTFVALKTLYMKEKERVHFSASPYQDIILRDKYIISESKIFYLYQSNPLDHGILDMEELSELQDNESPQDQLQKKFAMGPYTIDGNEQFTIMYNLGVKRQIFKLRMYQMPDSVSTTLINDTEHSVKLATFLDKQTILVQIGYRYIIFD